jgi:hypothetical protein
MTQPREPTGTNRVSQPGTKVKRDAHLGGLGGENVPCTNRRPVGLQGSTGTASGSAP